MKSWPGANCFRTRPCAFAVAALTLAACSHTERVEAVHADGELETPESAQLAEICTEASRSWDLFDERGRAIGRSSGQCLAKDGRLYRVMVQRQDEAGRLIEEYHLLLDDDGRPHEATLRTPYFHTSYLWRDDAISSIRLGDQASAPFSGRPWLLPIDAIYLRELMIRTAPVSASQVATAGLSLSEVGTLAPTAKTRALKYNPAPKGAWFLQDESLTVELSGDSLRSARITRVTDKGAGFVAIERSERGSLVSGLPEQLRPVYSPPSNVNIVPLRVAASGEEPVLAGELVIAADGNTDPRPGVLFLSGSGPQDRYGFVPNSSIDIGSHEIHDALVAAGFAVLRFDDRGTGESEVGGTATPGYRDFVGDASRALVSLGSQPQVDPSQLFVIGHSEGAITALLLAQGKVVVPGRKGRHKVRGVITLALPSRNIADVIVGQIRTLSPKDDPEAIERSISETNAMFEAIRKGEALPAQAEPMRQYLYDLLQVEPLAEIKRLRVPMLALQGTKDFQVDPLADFGPIAALLGTHRDRSAARLIDDLDHLMKPERGTSSVGHYSDLRRRVDPSVINAIVTWCTELGALP